AHPQELRPTKSCPPAPYRPRHLARPPRYSLNRTQNEARCLEKAALLRALCSSAIALRLRGRAGGGGLAASHALVAQPPPDALRASTSPSIAREDGRSPLAGEAKKAHCCFFQKLRAGDDTLPILCQFCSPRR